jgi:hypothetical protein
MVCEEMIKLLFYDCSIFSVYKSEEEEAVEEEEEEEEEEEGSERGEDAVEVPVINLPDTLKERLEADMRAIQGTGHR